MSGATPPTDHEEIRHDLGAYVLGALDPAERDRLERHLPSCAPCRDELAALAVLPGLLSRVGQEPDVLDVTSVAPPSAGPVLERIAAERRRERRRQRWSVGVAVAAVLVVIGLLGAVTWPGGDAAATVYAADGATARVVATGWGMEVELEVDELPDRPGYVARAIAHDGHGAQIVSWNAIDGPIRLEGSCYLPADEVAHVEIVAARTEEVLTVLRPT